jgi:pyruvate/2-oxoacid:ferredoxin oxidoreductase beta subunit
VSGRFIANPVLPYCGGCGHGLVVRNTEKALEQLGLSPLDVILVTDIGCHGLIDSNFTTHTVHGLHGRAVPLASGIAASLPPGRKVVAYIGDGGAAIGLQHLMDAAHRNFDVTVIVHNNMLYGMTGGQPSSSTPCGFRTPTCPDGKEGRGADLCRWVHAAGAMHCRRVLGKGDFSEAIAHAVAVPGFSLLEVVEYCTSYGAKHNPGRSLEDITREAGLALETLTNPSAPPCRLAPRTDTKSLLDLETIARGFTSELDRCVSIVLAGSAGEGVQVAAEMFARAAIAAGLSVTKKGTYPVTVGIGYSVAELMLSPRPILHTAADAPDFVVVTSADGLKYCGAIIARMRSGNLLIDSSLTAPATAASVSQPDFRKPAGPRSAALCACAELLRHHRLFPLAPLRAEAGRSWLTAKLDIERLLADTQSD